MSSPIDKCWHDRMLAAGWRPVGGVTDAEGARDLAQGVAANDPDHLCCVVRNKDAPGQCVVVRRKEP